MRNVIKALTPPVWLDFVFFFHLIHQIIIIHRMLNIFVCFKTYHFQQRMRLLHSKLPSLERRVTRPIFRRNVQPTSPLECAQ